MPYNNMLLSGFRSITHPRADKFLSLNEQLVDGSINANLSNSNPSQGQEQTLEASNAIAALRALSMQQRMNENEHKMASIRRSSGFFDKDAAIPAVIHDPLHDRTNLLDNGHGKHDTSPSNKFSSPSTDNGSNRPYSNLRAASISTAQSAVSNWVSNSHASSSQTTLSTPPSDHMKGLGSSPTSKEDSPTPARYGSRHNSLGDGKTFEDLTNPFRSMLNNARENFNNCKSSGCLSCATDPKLKIIPCGCFLCLECGGRFWELVLQGQDIYCSCGQRVQSMVNIIYPSPKSQTRQPMQYGPEFTAGHALGQSNYPHLLPISVPAPLRSQMSCIGDDIYVPSPIRLAPEITHPATRPVNINSADSGTSSPVLARMLSMDAETAIQNAPFIELGRHALAQNWSCVKIGNIPYNVTSQELVEFLGKGSNLAPELAGSIGVHIIMDRSTGKTMDAYAEFTTPKDAWRCAFRRRSRVLGSRHLTLDVVDAAELMKDIFPRAKSITWEGVVPRLSSEQCDFGPRLPEIIGREELVLIVNHARTPHRSPFSRKCLSRSYQSLMSIVSKFPWFAVHLYTIEQRDYIFHALLSAVDILKRQIKRGMQSLDIGLLKGMVRVGVRCAGFTDSQKYELVRVAEFGSEGIQLDVDISSPFGFKALAKLPGIDRNLFEFYSALLELSSSPQFSQPGSKSAGDSDGGLNSSEDEDPKAKNTMSEMASLEWEIIDHACRHSLARH